MEKVIKAAIVVLLLTTSIFSVKAQSDENAYQAEIERMLELTESRQAMETMLINTYRGMGLPISNITGLSRAIVNGIWDDYIRVCVIPTYKNYFTLEEIKELNAFYETPVGQKFSKNTSNIMNECSRLTSEKLKWKICLALKKVDS